jgi:hypothetical protein
MKKKTKKFEDVLIYKGQRYSIMTADISESWPDYEVMDVKDEIDKIVPVRVFVNIRAVRIEKQRHILLPRFNK